MGRKKQIDYFKVYKRMNQSGIGGTWAMRRIRNNDLLSHIDHDYYYTLADLFYDNVHMDSIWPIDTDIKQRLWRMNLVRKV